MTNLLSILARILFPCLIVIAPVHSQEISEITVAQSEINQESSTPSFSLDELDALIEEDENPISSLTRRDRVDILSIIAFLSLAMISFFSKSKNLKYATMIVAVAYMGFMKSNLVSLVHIFGLVKWSFPIFWYNIPWYALMLFTIVSTVFWGRLYCGRICAFGALTQLMDRIIPSRFRFDLPRRVDSWAVYIKYVLLLIVVTYFVFTNDTLIYKYVEPFWMFSLNGSTLMWIMLGLLMLITIFIRNFYCRYLCAVGAGLGLLSNLTMFRIKRWKQCNTCKICENACEWGAIKGPKISVAECVRCDDCEILYKDEAKCPHWLLLLKAKVKRTAARSARY